MHTNDRPTLDEVEITPTMIHAGANVISHWAKDIRDGWVAASEVVPLVLSAMKECDASSRKNRH